MNKPFNSTCNECPRLAGFLADVKTQRPDYFCQPVPAFGDADPQLLIVGLAPGMHGANRTGRPFTGDYAGVLLYETLHRFGLSNQSVSEHAADPLRLTGCRITNAVKCLPPENKPTPAEIRQCNPYLATEMAAFDKLKAVLALGSVAHQSVLRALGLKLKDYAFGHAAVHDLPNGLRLYDSYHCSRYNTQTKRLTEPMFHSVFEQIINDMKG